MGWLHFSEQEQTVVFQEKVLCFWTFRASDEQTAADAPDTLLA